MLELAAAAASGSPHLIALSLAMSKTQEYIAQASALREETSTFRKTLESMQRTVEAYRATSFEEDSILPSEVRGNGTLLSCGKKRSLSVGEKNQNTAYLLWPNNGLKKIVA
jgi:hypothetical protein